MLIESKLTINNQLYIENLFPIHLTIPFEITKLIFSHLNVVDLQSTVKVSHGWQKITVSRTLSFCRHALGRVFKIYELPLKTAFSNNRDPKDP